MLSFTGNFLIGYILTGKKFKIIPKTRNFFPIFKTINN